MHGCMAARVTVTPGAARVRAAFPQWEDIRLFLAVARGGSFSAAARALGTDQSTASRRVAALEAALGRPLFERTSRGLLPTRHGEALVAPAMRVEEAVLALEDGARTSEATPSGRVRIALTEGLAQHVVVPQVLPALFRANPALSIDLVTGDDAKDLVRQEADIAIRFFRTPRGELVGRRAATLALAPLAARSQVRRLSRLRAEALPWIIYERGALDTAEQRWLRALGVTQSRLHCSSVETQMAAVRAGLGVALAPRALTRVTPGLTVLDGVAGMPPLPRLELFVVTRSAIRQVPRIARVFDALVETLAGLDDDAQAPSGASERS